MQKEISITILYVSVQSQTPLNSEQKNFEEKIYSKSLSHWGLYTFHVPSAAILFCVQSLWELGYNTGILFKTDRKYDFCMSAMLTRKAWA